MMKSETKSRRELMYHPVKRRRPGNVSELENARAGKRPITTPSLPILLRALWTPPFPAPASRANGGGPEQCLLLRD